MISGGLLGPSTGFGMGVDGLGGGTGVPQSKGLLGQQGASGYLTPEQFANLPYDMKRSIISQLQREVSAEDSYQRQMAQQTAAENRGMAERYSNPDVQNSMGLLGSIMSMSRR